MVEIISLFTWQHVVYKEALTYYSACRNKLEPLVEFISLFMCLLFIIIAEAMSHFILLLVCFQLAIALEAIIEPLSLFMCFLLICSHGIVVPNLCFLYMYKYGVFAPNIPVACIHIIVCGVYGAWWKGGLTKFVMKMKKLPIEFAMKFSKMHCEQKLRMASTSYDLNHERLERSLVRGQSDEPQPHNQAAHIPNSLERLARFMHAIWNTHCKFLEQKFLEQSETPPYIPVAQEDEGGWEMQHFTACLSVSRVSGG